MVPEAKQAPQVVAPDGSLVLASPIPGLVFHDVRSVPTKSGVVTELWRPEWMGAETRTAHVVYVAIVGFGETNWHCHKVQNDLLFVVRGHLKIAFYDDREHSTGYKQLLVLPFSAARPTLIAIPPGVWHALRNAGPEEAAFVTMNNRPFDYENPDDWRLPVGEGTLPRPF
jgi:dTDP-4-dehydrorhamnose 3,5-epimerase